ncbi:hypothetical protein [Streptococcus acidominimus]|uniref:Uncharacterized protein n=1 Tax=Streptococcus acidominimus TaxID=1326 RepID=A0A1Q8EBC2_STRAI|nr:hypothetical protein [Streptococcus acidominimus]OLF49077.1 hypothetical protein BU200_09300 [Streptococcus acidominimus]SUN06821.1 Uncharacterised protein [Streptococcus acidominimus]
MLLTRKDFICDHLFTATGIELAQEESRSEYCWEFVNYIDYLPKFQEAILDLFTINRVSHKEESPYGFHKSYPSARSFYLQKAYFCIGNHCFVTIDSLTGKFLVFQNTQINSQSGQLIIVSDRMPNGFYSAIRNSLVLLEIGHILYNVDYISMCFENDIKNVTINKDYIQIDFSKCSEDLDLTDCSREISFFKTKLKLRTSGPYYRKLRNLSCNYKDGIYDIRTEISIQYKKLFGKEYTDDSIKILTLKNDGDKFISQNNLYLPYHILNSEYNYVDFRYSSQYTLFLIKLHVNEPLEISRLVLLIGYIAQEICVENSNSSRYNRPVKQVLSDEKWEHYLKTSFPNYLQFYAVISGNIS